LPVVPDDEDDASLVDDMSAALEEMSPVVASPVGPVDSNAVDDPSTDPVSPVLVTDGLHPRPNMAATSGQGNFDILLIVPNPTGRRPRVAGRYHGECRGHPSSAQAQAVQLQRSDPHPASVLLDERSDGTLAQLQPSDLRGQKIGRMRLGGRLGQSVRGEMPLEHEAEPPHRLSGQQRHV
jgi:hypothetical protein